MFKATIHSSLFLVSNKKAVHSLQRLLAHLNKSFWPWNICSARTENRQEYNQIMIPNFREACYLPVHWSVVLSVNLDGFGRSLLPWQFYLPGWTQHNLHLYVDKDIKSWWDSKKWWSILYKSNQNKWNHDTSICVWTNVFWQTLLKHDHDLCNFIKKTHPTCTYVNIHFVLRWNKVDMCLRICKLIIIIFDI